MPRLRRYEQIELRTASSRAASKKIPVRSPLPRLASSCATMATMETQAPSAPRLISIRQVAELANVSRTHLWRLVRRGEVDAVRVGGGGHIRIPAETFLRWLYGGRRALDDYFNREREEGVSALSGVACGEKAETA
jgi:excisionase family DNA binding protein